MSYVNDQTDGLNTQARLGVYRKSQKNFRGKQQSRHMPTAEISKILTEGKV